VSELDLLNLARSTTEHQVTWFAQMVTINFGMVVAIYYFLHGAKLTLKIFTFFAYSVAMMVLLGEMLVEANIKVGVIEALHALPAEHLSRPIGALSFRLRLLARAHHTDHVQSFCLVVLVRDVLSALFLETKLEPARFQIIFIAAYIPFSFPSSGLLLPAPH
jgi:hypothetical protein